jgi:hypothetical protein
MVRVLHIIHPSKSYDNLILELGKPIINFIGLQ